MCIKEVMKGEKSIREGHVCSKTNEGEKTKEGKRE
jgi:hypothetical protein